MMRYQKEIEESVLGSIRLLEMTREKEVVTEDDYFHMMELNKKAGNAAYIQNSIQIETERVRNRVSEVIKKQIQGLFQKRAYAKLQKLFGELLHSGTAIAEQMIPLKRTIDRASVPIEENEEALANLKRLRNPQ